RGRNPCKATLRLNLLLEPLVDFSSDPRDEARLNHDAFLYCGSELFDAPGQAHTDHHRVVDARALSLSASAFTVTVMLAAPCIGVQAHTPLRSVQRTNQCE